MGLADNRVTHYEALARMIDLDGSVILPGPFIDIAERFGLVGAISRAIFTKAFALQEKLQRAGTPVKLCLNVSGKELGDREFLYFLRSGIFDKGIDPGNLVFEITETASIHDLDKAMSFISALKEMGCQVSLDDFGIGFTSFLYLREMQVDYIKIAGSFIKALDQNLNDQLFVKAITEVARGMNIKTIGEFVETGEIMAFLKKFGVDYAQGYLIGRPAPDLLASDTIPALANG
jgi:EAL domain-containing protein (putative c-di-GMP-specific phosphodiesterase class I)